MFIVTTPTFSGKMAKKDTKEWQWSYSKSKVDNLHRAADSYPKNKRKKRRTNLNRFAPPLYPVLKNKRGAS